MNSKGTHLAVSLMSATKLVIPEMSPASGPLLDWTC